MEKLSSTYMAPKQHRYLLEMSGDHDSWTDWTFSTANQEKIEKFVAGTTTQNQSSGVSCHWLYLKNFSFQAQSVEVESEEILGDDDCVCDIDGIACSTIEVIESNSELYESQFKNFSKNSLSQIFLKVQSSLSETGFLNFIKILGSWEDQKLINTCFDHLTENEEAKLSVIGALTELAKNKPGDFGKCITKLIFSNSHKFTDAELLESVFSVMPNDDKDSIIMALTEEEHFKENNWHLLQVLICKTTETSLSKVIAFMNSKCEQFANSQAFARLLVHVCKNLQSSVHNDKLLNIIEKNKSLLKKQALKYLSSLES